MISIVEEAPCIINGVSPLYSTSHPSTALLLLEQRDDTEAIHPRCLGDAVARARKLRPAHLLSPESRITLTTLELLDFDEKHAEKRVRFVVNPKSGQYSPKTTSVSRIKVEGPLVPNECLK